MEPYKSLKQNLEGLVYYRHSFSFNLEAFFAEKIEFEKCQYLRSALARVSYVNGIN